MDIREAVEHCYDRKDYPEVFDDNVGLDIIIPGFITKGSWLRKDEPRTITLDVTTYRGVSWDAIHYYGNLHVEGIYFSPENDPTTITICKETHKAEDENPLASGHYNIELIRKLTQEEIDKDPIRWEGYDAGWDTNAFDTPQQVISLAKEVCKARFHGNWVLKIVSYCGSSLDEEILISNL